MTDALVPHAATSAQIERVQPQQPLAQGDAGRQMAVGKHAYSIALHIRRGGEKKLQHTALRDSPCRCQRRRSLSRNRSRRDAVLRAAWRESVVKINRANYEDVFWRETCLAWSAMIEMPTFEMPIMQPMLMAVSLKQHERSPVAMPTFEA